MKTYLTILDTFPPSLCRLLARSGGVGLTDKELAQRAGWSVQKVISIGALPSWESVSVGDMAKFMAACGIYPSNIRHHRRYLKRTLRSKTPLARLRLQPGATLRLLAALPEGVGSLGAATR